MAINRSKPFFRKRSRLNLAGIRKESDGISSTESKINQTASKQKLHDDFLFLYIIIQAYLAC
jgi:hypothetical protein